MILTNIQSLSYIFPELLLVLGIIAIFLIDLVVREKERLGEIALASAAVSLLAAARLAGTPQALLFTRMIAQDPFAVFFKVIFALSAMAAVWMSLGSKEIKGANQGEYYGLLLSSTLGMYFMASANNLLMAYLSLEFVSLTSYVLSGYLRHDRRSGEAALKYLIYGGVASGTMIYVRGVGGATENTIVRVTREGVAVPFDSSWYGQFSSMALAPDGRHLAVGAGGSGGGLNVWIKQLDRGPFTRLTFSGQDRRPAWSPDGKLVAFVRDTANTAIVVARPADGSGPDRRLAHLDRQIQEFNWSRDGQWILLRTDNSQAGAGDILGIRTSGDSTPVPLVASSFSELHPALSPDGRWLAYTSNESGVNEVYVRPFPNTGGGRSQVSNGGGSEPRWSGDGRALFFLDATLRTLIEARVTTAPAFAVSGLRPLFATSGFLVDAFQTSYDVTRDGRFFIFVSPRQAATRSRAPQVVRVDNWFSDLRARLAQ